MPLSDRDYDYGTTHYNVAGACIPCNERKQSNDIKYFEELCHTSDLNCYKLDMIQSMKSYTGKCTIINWTDEEVMDYKTMCNNNSQEETEQCTMIKSKIEQENSDDKVLQELTL